MQDESTKSETFSAEAIKAVGLKNPVYKRILDDMLAKNIIKVEEQGGGNNC